MSKEEIKVVEEDKPEVSKKFPSVITISSLFGVDEGTVLKFDFELGKYVSVNEEEEIGPGDSYYYSGSAVALDPYLVKQAIGNEFEYIDKEGVAVEASEPDLEIEGKSEPEVWDVADLVVKCDQCGSITKIDTIEKGVQFVMSTSSTSLIELVCPECKSKMSLFYENGRMYTEEELTEQILDSAEKTDKEIEDESQKESTE